MLTRQGLPTLPGSEDCDEAVARGAYVVQDCDGEPAALLLGTGSEVATLVEAANALAEDGIATRVVSLPCRERIWQWTPDERAELFPKGVPRISLEAATTMGWHTMRLFFSLFTNSMISAISHS